jgi:hypothetical protein
MAKRLGEAIGEPGERGGLFEVCAHTALTVAFNLGAIGSLVSCDLLGCPSSARLRLPGLRCHARIVGPSKVAGG